ncbi:MAG: tetratricopeptide repeat protein, partial [Deltaproteobacteria bacterium]|nr:tetratricopeptide repeat protein [Deltaproteobacteria bacterium]
MPGPGDTEPHASPEVTGDADREHQRALEWYGRELTASWDDRERAARLRYYLAQHLTSRSMDGPAEREYGRAADLTTSFRPTLRAARLLCEAHGETERADKLLDLEIAAAPAGPDRAALRRRRAALLAERGDLVGATLAWRAAVDESPADPASLRGVEDVARRTGNTEDLLASLRRQAEVTSDPGWRGLLLGDAAHVAAAGEPAAASEATTAALPLAGDPLLLLDLEILCERRGAWTDLCATLRAQLADQSLGPAVTAIAEARLGRVLRDRLGRPDEAVEWLSRSLRHCPGDVAVAMELQRVAAAHSAHHERAAAFASLCTRLTEPQALAAAYYLLGAVRDRSLNDVRGAVAALEKALELCPTHSPSLEALGGILAQRGDYRRLARMHRDEADRTQDPRRQAALLYRAADVHAHQLDERDAAVTLLMRALHLVPGYGPAIAALERLHGDAGRWRDLATVLEGEASRAADPRRRRVLWEAAGTVCAELLKEPGRAVEAWRRVLAMEPGSLEAIRALARLSARTHRYGELLELSSRELELVHDPRRQVQILERCGETAEQHVGDPNMAAEFYRRALALDAGSLPSLRALGRLYRSLGRYPDLAEMHRGEMQTLSSPERIERLLHELAEIHLRHLKMPAESAQDLREILKRRPGSVPALDALTRLLRSTGPATELCTVLEQRAEAAADPATRALLLWRTATEREEKLADFAGAAGLRERALSLDPTLDDLHADWSDPVRLMERYREALAHEPDGPRRRVLAERLGTLCERSGGNLREAATYYELAASAPGASLWVLRALARVYRQLDLRPELARTFDRLAAVAEDAAESASYLLRAAEQRIEHGAYAEAATTCGAARGFSRLRPYALALEETAARRSGDQRLLARALAARAAAAQESDHERAALWTEAGEALERTSSLAEAEAAYRAALKACPGSVLAHGALARLLREAGRFEDCAELACQRAEAVAAPSSRARALREAAAICAGPLGDAERAAELHRAALLIEPADQWSFSFLVGHFARRGDHRSLVQLLEARLPHVTDDAETLNLLVRAADLCLDRLAEPRRGARFLERALEVDPRHRPSLLKLADACFVDRRFDQALALYRRALPLVKDPPELGRIELRIALCLGRRGDLQAALGACERSIRHAPDMVPALDLCAELAMELGEFRTAALAIEGRAAHCADPAEKIPLLHRVATLCEERLDQTPRAARALEEALALNPLHLPSIEALTGVYTRMGDRAALDRHLRNTARLLRATLDDNPTSEEWLGALGRVLEWMEDADGAGTVAALRSFLAERQGQAPVAPRSPGLRRTPRLKLGRERYDALVVPPGLDARARALCRAIAPAIGSAFPTSSTRLAAGLHEPLPRRHPLRVACDVLAACFGGADYDLFMTESDPRVVCTASLARPALIVGSALQTAALRSQDLLRIGRALCLIAEGGSITLELPHDRVAVAFAAAIDLVRPRLITDLPSSVVTAIRTEATRLGDVMPRPSRKELKRAGDVWAPASWG